MWRAIGQSDKPSALADDDSHARNSVCRLPRPRLLLLQFEFMVNVTYFRRQLGTPWSDGVPGVTQKLIPVGQSFNYRWKANDYGTYWSANRDGHHGRTQENHVVC
jgi:Multicopper oxidase